MLTKNDLKIAIDVYTNANGGYFTALANTLTFWRTTSGRGIIRTFAKDSPQYLLIKDFMSSQYFKNLRDDDEVSFIVFNEFIAEKDKLHRFSSEYIHGDSAVVKTIINPWFHSLTVIDQMAILFANDQAFNLKNKSLTHHFSEFRNGMVDSVHATTRLVTAPITSTNNIIEALAHLPETLMHVGENIVNRPLYTLGTQIPALAVGQVPAVANLAVANVPGLQTVVSNIPSLPVSLPINPETLIHLAEKSHNVVHVGAELNHAGEREGHERKYKNHK